MPVALHRDEDDGAERLDREWWSRLQAGEEAALEGLFRAHAGALCDYATSVVHDDDSAKEIVQALFCWLWDHKYHLDTPRIVRAYLFAAVRNRCANQLRDARVAARFSERLAQSGVPVVADHESTDSAALVNDLETAIAREVAQLSPRRRDVFSLVRGQGMRHKEVAEILGIAPKTVEIHLARALEILKERLAHLLSQ